MKKENKEEVKEKKLNNGEEKKKKKIKIKDPFLLAIIVIILIGIFIFTYNVNYKITDVASFANNGYELTIKQIGEPMFMKENKIKATLKNGENGTIEEFIFYVYNKGEMLEESDITVNWNDEYAEVLIKGEGIKENTHNMYYEKIREE